MVTTAKTTTNKGARRQDEIIAAARDRLLHDGYAKFTLRDVAAGVGMSLGNLQYYYPARDDLVAAVIEDELEASFAIVGEVDWRSGERDVILRQLTRNLLVRLGGQAGQLYLIMAFLALTGDRFQTLVDTSYDRLLKIVEYAVIQAAPDLDADSLPMAVEVIVAIFDGAITRIHAQPRKFQGRALEKYTDMIAEGVSRLLST